MKIKRLLPIAVALALASPVLAAPNDPHFDEQWGMRKIGAETAWAKGTGTGIVIAIVDTGIDLSHEDLAAKLEPGIDYIEGDSSPNDEEGHGTHVAGIAAAITGNGKGVAGVAPGARIMPMRVLDENGSCVGTCRTSTAIVEAVKRGAKVINLSLGDLAAPVFGPGFEEALEYAWRNGAIPVVAAGNNYFFDSGFADNNALVVTATDSRDRSPDYASPVGQAKWALAAPGGGGGTLTGGPGVYSTEINGYGNKSGTSMAAPHVSGAAAVLLSLGLTPQQTVDRLLATAKDIGDPGKDELFGSGRLDLAAAVAGLPGSSGGIQPGTGATSGNSKSPAPKTQKTASPAGTVGRSPGEPASVTPNPEPSSDKTQAGPGPDQPSSSDLPKILGLLGALTTAVAGAFVWWKGRASG